MSSYDNLDVHVYMIVSIVLYSELRELESRLGELQVKTEIKSLEEGNKENTEAIQSKLKS